jgi:hypothetical protein
VEQRAEQTTRAQRPQRSKPVAPAHRVNIQLVAVASRGNCWLEVHRGSEAGPLLYEGTLLQGRSTAAFTGRRLWINVGAPSNVVIKVNGKRRPVPGTSVPREIVVSREGISPART